MTTNSITYNKHLEDQRSHKAQEAENFRNNLVMSNEVNRHNLQMEKIAREQLEELKRHQLSTEGLTDAQIRNAVVIADINRNSALTSAAIGASASRYMADQSRAASQYNADQSRLSRMETQELQSGTLLNTTSMNIDSSKSINEANVSNQFMMNMLTNLTKQQISNADRYQRDVQANRDRLSNFIPISSSKKVSDALMKSGAVAGGIF